MEEGRSRMSERMVSDPGAFGALSNKKELSLRDVTTANPELSCPGSWAIISQTATDGFPFRVSVAVG